MDGKRFGTFRGFSVKLGEIEHMLLTPGEALNITEPPTDRQTPQLIGQYRWSVLGDGTSSAHHPDARLVTVVSRWFS